MRARAEVKNIKRRLFNRHILSSLTVEFLTTRLRLCYYCNRLRRQAIGVNEPKHDTITKDY